MCVKTGQMLKKKACRRHIHVKKNYQTVEVSTKKYKFFLTATNVKSMAMAIDHQTIATMPTTSLNLVSRITSTSIITTNGYYVLDLQDQRIGFQGAR